MYRSGLRRLLVAAEDRRLALDAHEDREDRRRDDDVAHGDVALLEIANVAELEHHAPGDRADVAPGADDGADAAEAFRADVCANRPVCWVSSMPNGLQRKQKYADDDF